MLHSELNYEVEKVQCIQWRNIYENVIVLSKCIHVSEGVVRTDDKG